MDREQAFFGFTSCRLTPAQGVATAFDTTRLSDRNTEEARQAALSRRTPALPIPAAERGLFVVAVPRADVSINSDGGNIDALPADIRRPLVKCATGDVQGLASGVRSAIVKASNGRWMRLKGCGNNYDGFPLRIVCDEENKPVVHEGTECEEIRGCCFAHTVAIETLMSSRIASALAKEFKIAGNIPIGWYHYATPPGERYPEIGRYCGLYETVGDRRLSDHLLRGLELLLPAMVDTTGLTLSFPPGVFGPRCAGSEISDEDSTHLQYICSSGDSAYLADLSDAKLPIKAVKSSDFPTGAPENMRSIWDECCEILKTADPSLLGKIYWHIGVECGAFARILSDEGICWGTFRDITGTHCNAHGNNFVVKSPNAAGQGFLAPVDFDFAYTAETFVGTGDPLENIAFEKAALALDLAGSRDSTGTKNDHSVDPSVQALRWALRDTLVRGYLAGSGEVISAQFPDSFRQAAYAAITLALITTWNVNA